MNSGDNTVSVLVGNGDGTFQSRRFYYDGTTDAYQLALADMNGDGKPDAVVPGYGNNTFSILLNNGTGVFTNLYNYGASQNPIGVATGDLNGDGRTDLAFCHYYGNYVSTWLGNALNLLAEDPPGSGLRTAYGRGRRSNSDDVDYWQFHGKGGDQAIVAVDTVENPSSSQLYFQILSEDGSALNSFYPDYTGWGQSGVVTLPQDGTYVVRVAKNYDYQGEYRIRVTLASPPLQLENENNNSIANANTPGLTLTNSHLKASLAGYLSVGDGGDYYNLGNLLGGSTVRIGVREPASSGLGEIVSVYSAAGALMTNSAAGATNLFFTVPSGQDGVYYACLSAGPGGFVGSAETALRFSGGSDHVELGTWFNYQSFTLSFWARPAASQATYSDIMDDNHRAGINWVIQQDSGNSNHYYWAPQDGGSGVPFTLTPNTWQHVAITRDSTNVSRVYINGTLVGSNAAPSQINYDGSQFLRIAQWGGGGRGWNGVFDELRLWNRPLSQAEIVAGMIGALTGSEPDLAGYWRFNEGFGTNAFDLSPSNHTGLLVNGPAWTFLASTNAQPAGLLSQYILDIDMANPTPPAITGVTLPSNSSTNTDIITAFNVSFSEDMDARFKRMARNVYRYDGHSYLLTDSSTSWQNAEAAALSLGGHLAAINSSLENGFLDQTFSGYGELWIGLNMFAGGAWSWSSGDPVTYLNWTGGVPNNSNGSELGVKMRTDGAWDDVAYWTSLRGIIEVASAADTDNDGLVNLVDPYPNDSLNAFDLRASGPDGVFDSADDVPYRIYSSVYSSGLSATFAIADGPLQPGYYRFKITTSLTDRFGNPLSAPVIRYFTIAPVSGFVEENRRGTGGTSSTSLSLSPGNPLDGSFGRLASFASGRNAHFIVSGYFNQDTNLDLVVANYGDDNITAFTGDGAGSFQATTNIATGNGAISIAPVDFNKDDRLDLAVANYNANTVSILLGDGNGGFVVLTNYSGFNRPINLASADFNHDNKADLAVPNHGGSTVTVLFGNGDGTFQVSTNYTAGNQPQTVSVGDLNADGQPDLAVANYQSSNLSVLLGNADGTFQPAVNYPNADNTRYVALGDVNGDGRLDMVAIGGSTLNVFIGIGDGTFNPRVDYNIGSSDPYQVALADINNDGYPDSIVASYGNSRLITALNNGDGTFGSALTYDFSGNPISVALGDYNSDHRLDIATANYNGNNFTLFLGNNTESIAADPNGTGLLIAAGRGNLADSDDLDYWTFSAQTGDRLFIGSENPGDPGSSSLLYRIYYPNGSQWTYFYSDGNGRGQISLTVPTSGTYSIRVERNNQYAGEYRLRVTLAKAPVQLEAEDNNSIGQANSLSFDLSAGRQRATVLGCLSTADNNGDFFQLGNLADGTQISLGLAKPASSALWPQLEIYNAASALVSNSYPAQTNLVYTLEPGTGGAYYARVTWAYTTRDPSVTNGLYFNGGNNYVNAGNWSPGSQWSIQAWVMPMSLPGGRHTIAGGFGSCLDWGAVLQDGRFGVGTRQPGGCNITYQAPDTATPGTWYHVASVCDGTNASLYVDGALMATGPVEPNYSPYGGGTWIGGEACCGGNNFPGIIQDVSIWNRPLSQAEVASFRAHSPTGSETGLIGCWRLQDGAGTTVPDLSTSGHNGTLVNGPTWVRFSPLGSLPWGLMQQYLLSIGLFNTTVPEIVAVSLPAEGTTSSNLLDRFTITFSEDFAAASVTNSANYELLNSGADNVFGTADDQRYTVVNSPAYSSGTSASYLVSDGPLQPGLYRFTVSGNLANRTGTTLGAPYVRNFAVANIPGFVFENRFDHSPGLATSLSLSQNAQPNGSFISGAGLGLGSSAERIASGRINGDTNIDLVAALWDSGGVAVVLGNGDGSFQVKTNYATGNHAWSVALGLFNADANLDLAVANYGANNITILTGNGDGTFAVRSNYNVGTTPYHVVTADFNRDGKTDLAVPNYNSDNVSILLGNGDGSFAAPVNYPAGNGPMYAAVGDVNGDGKPDLLIANYNDNNVSLLFGNGNGTFAPAVTLAAGNQPRALVLADLDNNAKLDLAVFNGGDNTISVMLGNGDGSFQPRINHGVSTSDGYELLAVDLNGDGWRDLVVDGYNNNKVNVLLNQGDGTFQAPSVYSMGNRPVGLVAADFNHDGRVDLAVASDYGNNLSILLGNDTQPLALDAATGLRIGAGRGNIFNNSENDYWSFDVLAGERVFIACESPGNPGSSGLLYRIYYPSGDQWTYFYSDGNGRGQISLSAPVSGTYFIRVEQNYQYYGEYRLRVTLAPDPVQLESEDNNSTGNANALDFALDNGHRQATVLGCISSGDPGDFYRLGTLSSNSLIQLGLEQPAGSGFADVLEILDPSGTLVNSWAPAT
ncbi:MAG: FG-GAP-like repeat-containing protein [Candidatus Omnitrophica bacterium]|nr:FG-GAP-like repeat-containing protein [Candidatus Omnitrophota bacterium]